jgi:ABC-type nitrate/sulfonate/bicarbonate transport system ATPase subunit
MSEAPSNLARKAESSGEQGGQAPESEDTEIDGLSFAYGDRLIFSDFSLKSAYRIIVLKGPSGCGKTTLLKLLFGALRPSTARRLSRPSPAALVLQEDALFPWLSGRANITRFLNLDSGAIEDHPLFPVVADFLDRPAYQMSYGQRRSIELLRAILYKPNVLYLDEPFNYLDDSRIAAFIAALIDLSRSTSRIVMTTHRHDHSLDAVAQVFTFVGDPPYMTLERFE